MRPGSLPAGDDAASRWFNERRGRLGRSSSLRQLFEEWPNAAAIGCYPDSPQTIAELLRGGLSIDQALLVVLGQTVWLGISWVAFAVVWRLGLRQFSAVGA